MKRSYLLLVIVPALVGCQSGHIPNPNDPRDVGAISPDILRGNLSSVTDMLTQRLAKREISISQYRDLVTKAANELMVSFNVKDMDPQKAWQFGEVLKDAHRWRDADQVLRIAVKHDSEVHDIDRLVNDSLRLATVLAHEGQVPEAIREARTVFHVPPDQSAPILLGTYLEIVPAAMNQGHDFELAKLVEDAIACHLQTKVDPTTDGGKAFLAARPYHVSKAWALVASLYESAGKPDMASVARQKVDAETFGSSRL